MIPEEMKLEETPEKFSQRLEKRQSQRPLTSCSSLSCPLAQYLTAKNKQAAQVGVSCYSVKLPSSSNGWIDLPLWARDFITEWDTSSKDHGFDLALEIVDSLTTQNPQQNQQHPAALNG